MKKIVYRVCGGAAVGVLIGYLTVLLVNLCMGGGVYMPAMPALTRRCGTDMAAVLVQTLLTALIGVAFSLASSVFEVERWSFLHQCAVHFAVTALVYVPFTMLCWYPLNLSGILGVLGSVLLTYTITYFINHWLVTRDLLQINRCVQQARADSRREST